MERQVVRVTVRKRERKQKHVFCANCGRKIVLDDVIEQKFNAEETARQAREMQVQAQAVLDNDAVANAAVVSELGVSADDDAAKMVDDEVTTYADLARQLDARNYLDESRRTKSDLRRAF